MSGTQGNEYAAPNNNPNAAFGNVTISGGLITQGNATVQGSRITTGGETVGAGLSISGAAATLPGVAYANMATITGSATGTLTNSPHSGNPFTFLEITVNGTNGCIPVFALS